jgi:hypothetical protein
MRVTGTHHKTVDKNGKKEREQVTDFDIKIELTPYLYSNAATRASWREVRTVENGERVRRGTVIPKRAPGAKQSVELGQEKPTLGEWCHRFCASHAGLKCFVFRRRVVGFNYDTFRDNIDNLVRSTNYRGHINITFPENENRVELYNLCRTNRWRLTTWVIWLCVFTLTFLFTWPYLLLRTKRWEVVVADWHFSKPADNGRRQYVSLSEEEIWRLWSVPLRRSVLEKRQCTLDQQDLLSSQVPEPQLPLGNSVVDGTISIIRAGVNAMNHVNNLSGWGYDE